jgi:hypothetical protein
MGACLPKPAARKGRRRALLIGINYVGQGQSVELAGCLNDIIDARAMCAALRYDEVCVLYDGDWAGVSVFNRADARLGDTEPTRDNITAALRWLVAGAAAGDRLYLHYSGHGGRLRTLNADAGNERLVPVDHDAAGMICDDELRELLVEPLRGTGAVLRAVLDCCYSGAGMNLRHNLSLTGEFGYVERTGDGTLVALTEAAIDERRAASPAAEAPDVLVVSGCTARQTSAEAWFTNHRANGVLTYYLLAALRPAVSAGAWPSAVSLLQELGRRLRDGGFDQIPQISSEAPVRHTTGFDLT